MLAVTLAATTTNLLQKKQKSISGAARGGLPNSAPRLSPQTPFHYANPSERSRTLWTTSEAGQSKSDAQESTVDQV